MAMVITGPLKAEGKYSWASYIPDKSYLETKKTLVHTTDTDMTYPNTYLRGY